MGQLGTILFFGAAALGMSVGVAARAPQSQVSVISGVITEAPSESNIAIGKASIHILPGTRCAERRIRHRTILAGDSVAIGYDTSRQATKDDLSVQCGSAQLSVGAAVAVRGSYDSTGALEANQIIIFKLTHFAEYVGGSILEEYVEVGGSLSAHGVWIDGYPMQIGSHIQIARAPADTRFSVKGVPAEKFYLDHSRVEVRPQNRPVVKVGMGKCVSYRTNDGALIGLTYWNCSQDPHERGFAREMSESEYSPPDYERGTVGYIQRKGGTRLFRIPPPTMTVICDRRIQDYVTRVGNGVLPRVTEGNASFPPWMKFRFVVVNSLGKHTLWAASDNGVGNIRRRNIVVAMPDGLILIPEDGGVLELKSESQLAALLAIAETKVIQRQRWIADRAIGGLNFGPSTIDALGRWQELQAIRLGIRELVLHAYDPRDMIPALAREFVGQPEDSPGASPQKSTFLPWYSFYASQCLSQDYQGIDFTTMKRGEARFREFLNEIEATRSKPAGLVH